jgi:hypothetical protein
MGILLDGRSRNTQTSLFGSRLDAVLERRNDKGLVAMLRCKGQSKENFKAKLDMTTREKTGGPRGKFAVGDKFLQLVAENGRPTQIR